jgi:hypothetical protein
MRICMCIIWEYLCVNVYTHACRSILCCVSSRLILYFLHRWYWDILIIILLVFTVIVLPVSIAFYSENQTEPLWLTLNGLVDLLFITDIVINFRTGIASTDNPDIVSQNQSV